MTILTKGGLDSAIGVVRALRADLARAEWCDALSVVLGAAESQGQWFDINEAAGDTGCLVGDLISVHIRTLHTRAEEAEKELANLRAAAEPPGLLGARMVVEAVKGVCDAEGIPKEADCGGELPKPLMVHERVEWLADRLKAVTLAKDAAYRERNQLVRALTKVFPAWLGRHSEEDQGWEDDWRWIVFVDLPTGQVSWHIHDSDRDGFNHLSQNSSRRWDGHTTEEKYIRLGALQVLERAAPAPRRGLFSRLWGWLTDV